MALITGRQGYLGLAIEATPGTPEASPDTFLPFTENSIIEQHEVLQDNSSRSSRVSLHNSVKGQQWAEGDVAVFADTIQSGYLFKLALGNESRTIVSASAPAVHDHLFYVTASGNTPTTATLWNYRGDGVDVKRHSYSCVDQLTIDMANDELMTVTASFFSQFPESASAPTLTTASGTVVAWKDTTVQFGDTYADAVNSTAVPVTSLQVEYANNVEAVFESGQNTPTRFVMNDAEVGGEMTIFFEDDTYLNRFRENTKKCMVISIDGADIGNGYTENVEMVVRRAHFNEVDIDSDLDAPFALTLSFNGEQGEETDPGFFEVKVRNLKTTDY